MEIQRELFLPQKIEQTIENIRELCPEEGYYLAFSGGKDSQVLYDLTLRSRVKFDAHFSPTSVDPPEVLKFIRSAYPEVEFEKRETTMWRLIVEKKFPPTRRSRYCCEKLKEIHGWGRTVLTGIRADESHRRRGRQMVEFCTQGKGKTLVHPLFYWTEAEVWDYIKMRGIETCSLYAEGYKRIGCVLCPMTNPKHKYREAARFPNFVKAYLRAFALMIDERRKSGKNIEGWETPEKVMEWWLNI